jgi:hypothetical protein
MMPADAHVSVAPLSGPFRAKVTCDLPVEIKDEFGERDS